MKALGTILPTARSIAAGNAAYASDLEKQRQAAAAANLSGGEMIGGERRYYSPDRKTYRIVGRDCRIREFECLPGGDVFRCFVNG